MEIWSCRCAIYMQNYLSRTELPLQTWLFQGTNPAFHRMYNNTRLQPHLGYKVAPMLLAHGLARTIVNYTCNKHPAKTDRPALYNKNKPSQFRVKSPCLQRNRPRKGTATNTAIQKMCEKEFLKATNTAFVHSLEQHQLSPPKCIASMQQDMCRSCLQLKHRFYTGEVIQNALTQSQRCFVPCPEKLISAVLVHTWASTGEAKGDTQPLPT